MTECTLTQTGEYGKWQAIGEGVFVESHDRDLVMQVGRQQGCTSYSATSIPIPSPVDDCTIASNLCKKDSNCYVGDTIANAPGGCFEPGGVFPDNRTCEERGDCPSVGGHEPTGACPKGDIYTALFSDCDEGYIPIMVPSIIPGLNSNLCTCSKSEKGKTLKDKGLEEEDTLSKLLNMLPTLLIIMVIVSVIGAFKR